MRFILIFFFLSTISIAATSFFATAASNTPAASAKTEVSLEVSDSASWFERNLDLYIQADYFSFNPVNYTQTLTPEAKAELLQEDWLGTFTISDMIREKNYLKIDFSTEEFTKVMFITQTYFVLTAYTKSENGMSYGSSLLYSPQTNTLEELESLIVFSVDKNILECSKEHYSDDDGYIVEHGTYDVVKKKLTVEFVD